MTCRERTLEYRSIVQARQSRIAGAYVKQNNAVVAAPPTRSQFNKVAGTIGRNIANTCEKLEKLAMLVSNKSLFEDRSTEINQLTEIINEDLSGLDRMISELQAFSKNSAVQVNLQVSQHSNSVVVSLQSQLAHITMDFKEVLVSRTESIKEQKQRRDQFSSGSISSAYPGDGFPEQSLLLQSEQGNSSRDTMLDFSGMDQNQQLSLIDNQDTYLQERERNIKTIYSKIEELGSMMGRLSQMIANQGETISLLDTNVTDIQTNVDAAHSELLKYFQSISSNRWLMFKVFGILIVFFIIFVVFMA
ncbi:syntaxin-5-like [Bolinopsis microptera]|uniref:syntaxin-5-like n=1 Tax=Bolinopsis microptera TaxID=2820187 RepID=UPI003079960A